uniref:Pco078161 n=1 Tax=Arundo donax TaxID=35708 RepID=A0A0A9CWY2_ARUDO
MGCSTLSKP